MTQAERISQEVQRINEAREFEAERRTRDLLSEILKLNQQIVILKATVAEHRRQLSLVEYTPVTVAEVLGQQSTGD